MYIVYTDGGYSSKYDVGGIGFIIYEDDKLICQFSKAYRHTTNQRMEIRACIVALQSIKNSSEIIIYTDSMYVVGTMMNGWKRKANIDLWEILDNCVQQHTVEFKHIKGHSTNENNNKVDELATQAINKYK